MIGKLRRGEGADKKGIRKNVETAQAFFIIAPSLPPFA